MPPSRSGGGKSKRKRSSEPVMSGGEEIVRHGPTEEKEPVSEICGNSREECVSSTIAGKIPILNPKKNVPEDFFMLMYGVRRCGKTTMMRELLYTMWKNGSLANHKVFLICESCEVDPDDYKFIPPTAQFSNLEAMEDELMEIIDEQEKEGHDKGEKVLVILDDVINENGIRHSRSLNKLAVQGRHTGISVILLSQMVAGSGSVPPIIRTQADLVFVCANPRSQRERSLLSEWYLTAEDKRNAKESGLAAMASVLKVQYRAMVISMEDPAARRIRDYTFMYGPVPEDGIPSNWRMGTDEQWANSNDDSDSDSDSGAYVGGAVDTRGSSKGRRNLDDDDRNKSSNGTHDYHGGTRQFNRGTEDADADGQYFIRKSLRDQFKNVPPALSGNNRSGELRSFSAIGYTGSQKSLQRKNVVRPDDSCSRGMTEFDYFLSGWSEEKPTARKQRDFKKFMKSMMNSQIKPWSGLKPKKNSRSKKVPKTLFDLA